MSEPTPLRASRTSPTGPAGRRSVPSILNATSLPKISPRRRLFAALAGATLALCILPASTSAQQQTAGLGARPSSLPDAPIARTLVPEGSASVAGIVLDLSGASVPGADVTLMPRDGTPSRTMLSEADGEFDFVKILPGSYLVMVTAKGFAIFTSAEFVLAMQQSYQIPDISLSLAATSIEVTVRPTELIAAEQIRVEEKQRLVGVIPNFYTSYVYDAAPLTSKQKFSLALRGTFDPVSILGVGFAAGIEQATNAFAGYGQGAAGYSKRFAAKFVDGRTSDMLTHAVFPTLLHQDPRYYYLGSGSVKTRLWHAVGSAFITRTDSGGMAPNYSYLFGDVSAAALSNLYYPEANRGVHLVFTNAAVGLAGRIGGNIFREFLSKHLTTNVPAERTP
jgi:Carboxypeptidase regulatory-like domain